MDEYQLIWSRESIYDVADIADYIECRFGPERAERFLDEITHKAETLRTSYKLNAAAGICYRQKLIFKKVFGPSVIFYFVDEAKKSVFIIRVLRHERNWQRILRDEISYTFE